MFGSLLVIAGGCFLAASASPLVPTGVAVRADATVNVTSSKTVAPRPSTFWDMFSSSEEQVDFLLFIDKQQPVGEKFSIYRRKLFHKFDPKLQTKILIHGWRGNGGKDYPVMMKDALLATGDMNILIVDWSLHGSQNNYMSASNSVAHVADLVALFIDDLVEKHGIKPEDIHILGHSLGAHISGVTGKKVTKGKIGRITGFDPAGVFYSEDTEDRLRPDCATFVDIVHSNTKILGHKMRMGQVDFYPNGGKSQPGCGSDLTGQCAHSRSYEYYIEALTRPLAFPAVNCKHRKSFENLDHDECDFKKINFLGPKADPSKEGRFYLQTNEKSPYGKGATWA